MSTGPSTGRRILSKAILLGFIRCWKRHAIFWIGRIPQSGIPFDFFVSTDEVFGSIESGAASETSHYAPSSPYAASKASADHLVRAWQRTYRLPTLITNCSNNYGPYQFPEKLIPLMVSKAVRGEPLPVYGDGRNEREWLHVADHCAALENVLARGGAGETYNIGSGEIHANRDVVMEICAILDDIRPRTADQSYSNLIAFTDDRPGHDARYALDSSRMRAELGWAPATPFAVGLRQTVNVCGKYEMG